MYPMNIYALQREPSILSKLFWGHDINVVMNISLPSLIYAQSGTERVEETTASIVEAVKFACEDVQIQHLILQDQILLTTLTCCRLKNSKINILVLL